METVREIIENTYNESQGPGIVIERLQDMATCQENAWLKEQLEPNETNPNQLEFAVCS